MTSDLIELDGAVATDLTEASVALSLGRRARLRGYLRQLARTKTFVVGLVIVGGWVIDAITWRLFVPHDPQATDPTALLKGPSAHHFFGTDDLGRDMFSRVLAGSQYALTVPVAATVLGLIAGTVIGLVAGYYRGIIDDVIMRLIDALLAFPAVIIAVLILAVLGRSTVNVVLVIAVIFAPLVARTVRAAVLGVASREFVDAAKGRGDNPFYIMGVEILPNIAEPLAVEATIRLAYAVFTAATLSFLSLGIQQPAPDWGLSIALGRAYLQVAPWVVLFPAAALASLIVGVNLIIDGMRQVSEQ